MFIDKRDYKTEWQWVDNNNNIHKEPSAQWWNREKILKALRWADVVSIFSHGGNRRGKGPWWIGPYTSYDNDPSVCITPEVLQNRYPKGFPPGLRLVVLLVCRTGGKVDNIDTSAQPQSGKIAAEIKRLGAECVIYWAAVVGGKPGTLHTSVANTFADYFWNWAPKGIPNTRQRTLESSVALVVDSVRNYLKATGDWLTRLEVNNVRVVGDTRLAP